MAIFILYLIFIILIMTIISLFIIDINILLKYKYLYFYGSLLIFLLSLWIGLLYSIDNINNNIIVSLNYNFFYMHLFYNEWYIDNISICFIILTTLLITVTIGLGLANIKQYLKEYLIYFFILEILLLNFFLTTNLMLFYIYFEAILIPMFLIILMWGSRKRKIHASYLFFFFTLIGSLFMLTAILWYYIYIGDLNMHIMQYFWISKKYQIILWVLFFIGFAVKIPIYPVHTWLPEAHVEAPTSGSIILAGILLKLGLYGMLRILIILFPIYNIYYTPLILTLGFISTIYISLIILQQIDLKKIIAYSSIAHMNLAVIGLFVNNIYGIEGCIYTMLSHGLISTMLFFCIGILYERYYERNILYYSNIVQIMPFYTFFFFIAIVANMGIPSLSSFIGEFLLLLSSSYKSIFLLIIISFCLLLATMYCIWLYNRISFGIIIYPYIQKFKDITKIEYLILVIITILILYYGLYPNCILNLLHDIIYFNIYKYLNFIKNNIYLKLKELFFNTDDFFRAFFKERPVRNKRKEALKKKKAEKALKAAAAAIEKWKQTPRKPLRKFKLYECIPPLTNRQWRLLDLNPFLYENDKVWHKYHKDKTPLTREQWDYVKKLRKLLRISNILCELNARDPREGCYKNALVTRRWKRFKIFIDYTNPKLLFNLCGKRYDYPLCVNDEKEFWNMTKFQGYLWCELRFWEQKIRISNSIEPVDITKRKQRK